MSTASVLNWDMLTYMPPKGAQLRGEQLSTVSQYIHRLQTSREYGDLLKTAEKEIKEDDTVMARNLYLIRRNYDRQTRLPEELVADIMKQSTTTRHAWMKAKNSIDWSQFEPELSKMFELIKKQAELLMEVKGTDSLYDTVLDDFEPKMKSTLVARAFSKLRDGLVPMIEKYADASKEIDVAPLLREVPKTIQEKILLDVASLMGYDTSTDSASGRIDETHHPFTTGYYDDVRVTVRYNEDNPLSALLVLMHEAGHAVYEQSLRQDWMYQPIGTMAGLGIHESISRFYENMIGRSDDFWKYYLPRFNELSDGAFRDLECEELLRMINRVVPSKVRVSADELTYSIHVIIRYEIETALFDGSIEVSELPQIWNEKYSQYLGVSVDNDSEGVMQDSHWADGMFGYFPTYALGNLYGAMWYEKINEELPCWRESLNAGSLAPVYDWLKENVMGKSNLLDPSDLVKDVTGNDLTAKPFLDYLTTKYSSLF
ncbi:MAG: carboxypeptidase M32 [Candidatus Thorarchaeota archaeon]|nr:MAG: carboxypeptidase M32 [Candidatus Thorarchaeota archaeon]